MPRVAVPKAEEAAEASFPSPLPEAELEVASNAGEDDDLDFNMDVGLDAGCNSIGEKSETPMAAASRDSGDGDEVDVPTLIEADAQDVGMPLPCARQGDDNEEVAVAVEAPVPGEAVPELWLSICIACPFPRCYNNRFCRVHKRVWDSIYRDINAKKKKQPAVYQAEMSAHKKISSSDTLSAHKVLEFQRQFPEVIPGKRRGAFDHCRFSDFFAATSFSSEQSWGKMTCFIEYSRKMDRNYGWTLQQARARWQYWKNEGVKSDVLGEVEGWAERLYIPKGDFSVVGEQFSHSKELIEERTLHRTILVAELSGRRAPGMT